MNSSKWIEELLPIAGLLAVITIVVRRLPRIDLGHSKAFRTRRFLNWFPVGLTYAFLYMARYNLNACKIALGDAMTKQDFARIFTVGTITYGVAFLLNGPLTDRWGGRATMLIAAGGSLVMNGLMGLVLLLGLTKNLVLTYSILYAGNMYFQSFGAVSIVKVNSAWFHVRERGTFGGIFGILISLGLYFAYDWGDIIVRNMKTQWVFFIPAMILAGCMVWTYFAVRNSPGEAGQTDFDTADASSGDTGPPLGVVEVGKRMLRSPVILTIGAVEFCSGYLRNAIMQWYKPFAVDTGLATHFVYKHWGMLLCIAGIFGGVVAGAISDVLFQSRRGPVAAFLYGGMVVGTFGIYLTLTTPAIGWVMVLMSLCIIGVHGMLSGTASMDFGGKRNVGVAVGIIDGFVYLGTALQSFVLGKALPTGAAAKDPANWSSWPMVLLPAAAIGLLLATRVWHAKPQPKGAPAAAH